MLQVEEVLVEKGWDTNFLRNSMSEMVISSIMSGNGNSGDLVRVVIGVVQVLLGRTPSNNPIDWDQTRFWSNPRSLGGEVELDIDGIVALTKFFVLE
jgi:hypothetical protein